MKKSYIYALSATLLWGSSAAVIKLLLKNLNSLQILLFVSGIASINLFLIVLFQKKIPIIQKYKIKDYLTFAYMGFIGVFIYYLFLYLALSYLKAQEAFIINYLWPMMIVIFAVPILKEKLNVRKILAIIFSFIGVIIIATKGNFSILQFTEPLGILLAIIAAMAYGLFSVLGKKQNYDKSTSMLFYYISTFIYTLIFIIFLSFVPQITLAQLGGLLWMGIFTSGGAFLLWFLALKYGDTAKIANIAFLTPFFSLIYIYFLLHETILISSVVGLLFIFIGIFIQNHITNNKSLR
ncbi:MAG: DMT family transporter [Candidatus Paceibacterota bacterium]